MKKLAFLAVSSATAVSVGLCATALASPTGTYFGVGGGAGYVTNSSISAMQFPMNGNVLSNPTPVLANKFTPMAQGTVGHYFNNNSNNSWAFGVEMNYDYFAPTNSSVTQGVVNGSSGDTYNVKGQLKANTWASTLMGVISEDISPKVSLLYKLGIGYEDMKQTFTSTTLSSPSTSSADHFNSNSVTRNKGFGVAGGVGLQYAFTDHLAWKTEIGGMKGGKNIGFANATTGVQASF